MFERALLWPHWQSIRTVSASCSYGLDWIHIARPRSRDDFARAGGAYCAGGSEAEREREVQKEAG